MAGPIIKAEDLFDPSILDTYAAAQKKYNDELARTNELVSQQYQFKTEMQRIDFKDSESIKKYNKLHSDSLLAEEKIISARQRNAKLAIELANKQLAAEQKRAKQQDAILKAQQKEEAQVKKNSSAYAQLNEKYKDAAKRAKDFGAQLAGGDKSVEANFKVASNEALNYRNQLVAIDAATGQTQRRVGDYGQELGKLGRTLKATGMLGRLASEMLGIDPEIANGIREAGMALKDAKHVIEGTEGAHEANTIAIGAETAAMEEEAAAADASTAGITLLVGALVAGAAAIYNWVSAAKEQNQIDLANIETAKTLKENDEESVRLLNEEVRAIIKLKVLKKELSQQDADAIDNQIAMEDELKKRRDKYAKDLSDEATRRGVDLSKLKGGVLPTESIGTQLSGNMNDPQTGFHQTQQLNDQELAKRKAFNDAKAKLEEQYQIDVNTIKETYQKKTEIKKVEDDKKDEKKLSELTDRDRQIIAEMEAKDKKEEEAKKNLKKWEEEADAEQRKNELENIKTVSDAEIEAHNAEIDAIEEIKKKKKDAQKEEREEIKKTLDFAEESLNRKDELTEKQLNNDLDMRQRNIIQQQQLAAMGYNNTLAFEKAAAAKDELRKQQEAIKQQKQAKALAIFRLLAANAQNGKTGQQALVDTLTEMALAGAIAGSYFEGTENVGRDLSGNKVHSGRDGYRIAVDGSERIFNGEQNSMIGDISNDEAARVLNAYQNGYIPGAMTAQGSLATNIAGSMAIQELGAIKNEVAELKEIFKSIPRIETKRDEYGNITEKQFKNGMMKIITKKNNSPLNYI